MSAHCPHCGSLNHEVYKGVCPQCPPGQPLTSKDLTAEVELVKRYLLKDGDEVLLTVVSDPNPDDDDGPLVTIIDNGREAKVYSLREMDWLIGVLTETRPLFPVTP